MQHRPLITMTTDFGYDDSSVGVMKGVIYSINPHLNIVDLTHNIAPQGIQEAAFTIGMNYQYFPPKAIHLVVVDPGVGSGRRPLLVVSGEHYFIGPDNGVFSYIYKQAQKDLKVLHITSEHFFLKKDSPTFQGRDVFSPCAAWLSTGLDIDKFGEVIEDYHAIHLPAPLREDDRRLKGEVILIDRFGNAMTNIKKSDIDDLKVGHPEGSLKVTLKGREIPFRDYYSQAGDRSLSALINSSGYLEIFIYSGSAASEYDIRSGDAVEILLS
jgi:S-adenosyl-L-methionine hydrolase (adenosine-forming)